MTKTLLLVGGGVLAYSLLSKGHSLGTVNFYADTVRSLDFEGSTPVLKVGLRVQNTTTDKFVVRSIAGNVMANDYLVGNVGFFTAFEINPNSEQLIFIDIRFALIGIVNDIVRAFQTGAFAQSVEFKGFANVDNFQVPIDLVYKVGA